jgi:adenylate cyclase
MTQEMSDQDKIQKAKMEREIAGLELSWKARGRRMFAKLPSDPRCTLCLAPFEGWGGSFVKRALNKRRSTLNPLFCSQCEDEAKRLRISIEVEMSMLFADIRGSTSLAESMRPAEFSAMIDRFYTETTHVLIHSYAIIDKLAGDQVSGYYLPGVAGTDFAQISIKAARDMLRVTGNSVPERPWVPMGVGINTGKAVFGYVGKSESMMEITALGDAVNVAARLASKAGAGEALLSESTVQKAGMDPSDLGKRTVELKGKSEPMDVWVMRVNAA